MQSFTKDEALLGVGLLLLAAAASCQGATTASSNQISTQIALVQRKCYECPLPGEPKSNCANLASASNKTIYESMCTLGWSFCKKTRDSNVGSGADVTRECAKTCTEKEIMFGVGAQVSCCQTNLCNSAPPGARGLLLTPLLLLLPLLARVG